MTAVAAERHRTHCRRVLAFGHSEIRGGGFLYALLHPGRDMRPFDSGWLYGTNGTRIRVEFRAEFSAIEQFHAARWTPRAFAQQGYVAGTANPC